MKIFLSQLNFHIGNFEYNEQKIINEIEIAKQQNADIVVFAELAICGYPPQDFLEFDDFIQLCIKSVNNIAKHCVDIAAIVGSPSINPKLEGKNLFNSAYFLCEGKISSTHNKALLPNYDVFDEYRYFEPSRNFSIIEYKDKKIALTICEDLWDIGEDPMYTVNPMDELLKYKPDILINCAASPFDYNHAEERKQVLQSNAQKYNLPLFYVNHVGAQTEIIFDGGSMAIDNKGNIVKILNYFEEDNALFDTEDLSVKKTQNTETKTENIHDALVLGIKDYFKKMNFTKAILGLSGGIDSAVTLVLASKALGNRNVKAVLLPSQFSSQHSIDDAIELAKNLDCDYEIIPIEESYKATLNSVQKQFGNLPFSLAEENMQARLRAVILMALSNKLGYILLNTSNKSEAAVGYGTLYGDMCGGLSVLGDVYKTEVYELANFINREKEIIPVNSINKPPSAELRPNQKDSDSLPDYDILDKILFQYIEKKQGPTEIKNLGFDAALVDRILKLVNSNEYKRFQTAPILRVSPKAFGMGRRMPLVGKYLQ